MVTTRSTTASPVKRSIDKFETQPEKSSPLQTQNPLTIFVLPRDISDEARILSLPHPRDGTARRFLFCPRKGLYEFTKISVPTIDRRSVLFSSIEQLGDVTGNLKGNILNHSTGVTAGYVNKEANYVTATLFDLKFLLISLLYKNTAGSSKTLFQPLDDLLEDAIEKDKSLKYIVQLGREMIEKSLSKICDSIEAGDERMYRINLDKILKVLYNKAKQCTLRGLPASLEEKFVTRTLEAPILSIRREDTNLSLLADESITPDTDSVIESFDSQSSTTSTVVSSVFSEVSTTSTTDTIIPEVAVSAEARDVTRLQRLRTAFRFITASYLPSHLATEMQRRLATSELINFEPLDTRLKHLEDLKADTMASRSITDFGRKRASAEEEEMAEIRAEKKRKQEDDEKRRKANESRGVRDLKKVNVSGMKKMSEFFTKKPGAAKAKT